MEKKTVCIVTVYNSENCGSFLQAWALSDVLEGMGYRAVFLKRGTKGTTHSFGEMAARVAKNTLCGRFSKAKMLKNRYRAFAKVQKRFTVISESESHKVDHILIGSDTLWNFDIPYFAEHAKRFTGGMWQNVRKATYAVSAANTEPETVRALPGAVEDIRALHSVSVRDRHTAQLVESLTGDPPVLVCDPTMLVSADRFDTFCQAPPGKKFMAVYYFGHVPDDLAAWIRAYAEAHDLEIVAIGGLESPAWCRRVENEPETFITYMKHAEFVVTNTFHGTLFSALFEREFVSYTADKRKVMELLAQLGASDRLCADVAAVCETAARPVDYQTVRAAVNAYRQISLDWLGDTLARQSTADIANVMRRETAMKFSVYMLSNFKRSYKTWKTYKRPDAELDRAAGELIRNTHSVEKGLSISEPKLGFGHAKQTFMLELMAKLKNSQKPLHKEAMAMATDALWAYIDYHDSRKYHDDFIEMLRTAIPPRETRTAMGGTTVLERSALVFDREMVEHLFTTRHSIRTFDDSPIDRERLENAIRLANTCPSACNRQCSRVYLIEKDSPHFETFRAWLTGIGGFENDVPAFLLVTGNMSMYRPDEDYQYIVSAGIFAGYLSLALHASGMGACVIQRTPVWNSRWDQIRTELGIPADEQAICTLSVGNLKETTTVPVSHRLSVDTLLTVVGNETIQDGATGTTERNKNMNNTATRTNGGGVN